MRRARTGKAMWMSACSSIDAWSRPGGQRFELRVRLTSDLIHALGNNNVDLVILNDAPPLLARRIVRAGIEVFCRDRNLDRDFRRDVQIRAADLAPFLERYRRMTLDALAG